MKKIVQNLNMKVILNFLVTVPETILVACTILQFLAHFSCRNLYGAKRGPQSSSWGLLNVENSAKKWRSLLTVWNQR